MEQRMQGTALEKLADEVRHAVLRADVEQRENVRVVEGAGRPRLALEAAQAVGGMSEPTGQDLDRHISAQSGIARAVDLPHAPGPEQFHDLIRTDSGAGGKRHGGPPHGRSEAHYTRGAAKW
jgi:hypothetical protein